MGKMIKQIPKLPNLITVSIINILGNFLCSISRFLNLSQQPIIKVIVVACDIIHRWVRSLHRIANRHLSTISVLVIGISPSNGTAIAAAVLTGTGSGLEKTPRSLCMKTAQKGGVLFESRKRCNKAISRIQA